MRNSTAVVVEEVIQHSSTITTRRHWWIRTATRAPPRIPSQQTHSTTTRISITDCLTYRTRLRTTRPPIISNIGTITTIVVVIYNSEAVAVDHHRPAQVAPIRSTGIPAQSTRRI
uniref:(northern house mosquito) hypothetical protein n=1 Tax=Culex pipiens TaxID=7175 RepID=A0A8D8E2T0_CULPI